MNRTLCLYIIFILFSCNSKENDNSKFYNEINTILTNELAINKEVKTIYVIQDNSCTTCFKNIVNIVDHHETPESIGVIYLSKFKKVSQQSISFLNFRDLNPDRKYVSNNKRLRDLLLKSVGGFSKGFYVIKIENNKDLLVSALD